MTSQSLYSSPCSAYVLAREAATLCLGGSLWAGSAAAEWWRAGWDNFNCQWAAATETAPPEAWTHTEKHMYSQACGQVCRTEACSDTSLHTEKSGSELPVHSFLLEVGGERVAPLSCKQHTTPTKSWQLVVFDPPENLALVLALWRVSLLNSQCSFNECCSYDGAGQHIFTGVCLRAGKRELQWQTDW